MTAFSLVDATTLESWAARRDAQHMLPRLVRRLVHATANGLTACSFRAGEGVQLAGWDGLVAAEAATAFVPGGPSAWELGTGKDPREKADSDYTGRSDEPLGVEPATTTFVFVTPRRWPGKENWAAERRAERRWLDVRVYDADDLEAWLEVAPAVNVWMWIQLGRQPGAMLDLETYWRNWTDATDPPITSELVTAGRDLLLRSVQDWIAGEDPYLALKADSREEAVILVAACVERLDQPARDGIHARAVVVLEEAAWQELSSTKPDLLLLPLFDGDERGRPPISGQRLIVPLGNADAESSSTLVADRISTERAVEEFSGLGLDDDRARELAMLARRSLISLRRRLATQPQIRQPRWAKPEHARALLPALFAGAWDERTQGDQEVLASLAGGVTYSEVQDRLIRWVHEDDPPLRHMGSAWYLVSKEDGWNLLARYATADDWVRFVDVVEQVLGSADPAWDSPASERFVSSMLQRPQHSGLLRHSLADTLALLGANGDAHSRHGGDSPRIWAERAAWKVFQAARGDWRVWASLGGLLPLLAEAAPEEFLQSVDAGLSGDDPMLRALFEGDDDSFMSTPGHVGLLWALENVAWDPQHLPRAVVLLGRLASLDPGGRSANRPINTLVDIFRPWLPQTSANLRQRIAGLDLLAHRQPRVAWTVMARSLPTLNTRGNFTHRPRWRNWALDKRDRPSVSDHLSALNAMIERLLELAGHDATRWKDLIQALGTLPAEAHDLVVTRLSELEVPEQDKGDIWLALRELVAHHRSYPEAKWSMPAEKVDLIAQLLDRFAPSTFDKLYGWLFTDAPRLMEERTGWTERQTALQEQRAAALRHIYRDEGVDGLLALAEQVDQPGVLGEALGRSELGAVEEDDLLHGHLASSQVQLAMFVRGFAYGRSSSVGREWGQEKLSGVASSWPATQQAELVLALPTDAETWDLATSLGPSVEERYWRTVRPWMQQWNHDLERAIEHLLTFGRPFVAIDLMAIHLRDMDEFPLDLLARAVEACLLSDDEHDRPGGGFRYDVAEVVNALAEAPFDRERLARIEWGLMRLLRFDRPPMVLHAQLAASPKFFAEVVEAVFRSDTDDGSSDTVSEEQAEQARTAYELLQSWRTIPGAMPGGIDAAILHDWVQQARERLAASGRAAVGDGLIGQTLSGSPAGSDGFWPAEAVRDLIEVIRSDELESGLEVGVANSRGVVSKSLHEGGAQEWALCAHYEQLAEGVNDRWPRTAAMLRRIARSYRAEAESEDKRAALREELGP